MYFAAYVVLDPGNTELSKKDLLTEGQFRACSEKYGRNSFRAGTGAEAIQTLLRDTDPEILSDQLRREAQETGGQKRLRAIRRLEVAEAFKKSGNKPEWMILTVIPVIPPELRPWHNWTEGGSQVEEILVDQELVDTRLQHMLTKYIAAKYPNNLLLKKTRYCGSRTLPTTDSNVFVVTNHEKSRYYGLACCHSSWGCPRCSPKRMAEYGVTIACAIDALKTKYKESGVMFTFTLPHLKWMDVNDTFEILRNTWRAFTKNTGRITATHHYTLKTDKVGEKGTVVEYNKNLRNPLANMRVALDIKHSVRVYEFTWSEKFSWHPHIHALFWVPNKNVDKVLEWEDKLSEFWFQLGKHEAEKLFNRKYPDKAEKMLKILYQDYKMFPQTGHKPVYISKKKDGKVLIAASSHYICGWGADKEIANELKAKRAMPEHFSPRQMLEQAYENPARRDFWLDLYCKYLEATFGHRRVQFSIRSGLTAIIKQWTNSERWFQIYKKKSMGKETNQKPWHVVFWLPQESWSQICLLDSTSKTSLKAQILTAATNGREQVEKLLNQYDIRLPKRRHRLQDYIENKIFENSSVA